MSSRELDDIVIVYTSDMLLRNIDSSITFEKSVFNEPDNGTLSQCKSQSENLEELSIYHVRLIKRTTTRTSGIGDSKKYSTHNTHSLLGKHTMRSCLQFLSWIKCNMLTEVLNINKLRFSPPC